MKTFTLVVLVLVALNLYVQALSFTHHDLDHKLNNKKQSMIDRMEAGKESRMVKKQYTADNLKEHNASTCSGCHTWYPTNLFLYGHSNGGFGNLFESVVVKSSGSQQLKSISLDLKVVLNASNIHTPSDRTVMTVLLVVVPYSKVISPADFPNLFNNIDTGAIPSGSFYDYSAPGASGPIYTDKVRVLWADVFAATDSQNSHKFNTHWCLAEDQMRQVVNLEDGDRVSVVVSMHSTNVPVNNNGYWFTGTFNLVSGFP